MSDYRSADSARIVIDKTHVLVVTADDRAFLRLRSRRSGHEPRDASGDVPGVGDAYEPSDPKSWGYHSRMSDAWDMREKGAAGSAGQGMAYR